MPSAPTRDRSLAQAAQHVDELDLWQTQSKDYHEVYDAITSTQFDLELVAKALSDEIKCVVEALRAYIPVSEQRRLTETCCAITFYSGRDSRKE